MADSISERIFVDYINSTKRSSIALDRMFDEVKPEEQSNLLSELFNLVQAEYSAHKNLSEQDSEKKSAINELQRYVIYSQMERGNFANVLELVKTVEDGWRIYMDSDYYIDGHPEEMQVFDKMLSLAKNKDELEEILNDIDNRYSLLSLKNEVLFTKIFKRANELEWREECENKN